MHRVLLFIAALLLSLNLSGITQARADAGHHATHQVSLPAAAALELPPADWMRGHRHGNVNDSDGQCVSCCATACGSAAPALQINQNAFDYFSAAPPLVAMNAHGDGRELVPPSPPPRL